ncbi:pyridoxal-dependent decarboxylase, partial [Stutzerimonas stutzeri]
PVSCSGFFVRQRQHLSYITHHADYLNPRSQTREGTPNLVNKSIQTTRRFDALKLWLTLRILGAAHLVAVGVFFDHRAEALGTEDAQGDQELKRVESAGVVDVLVDPVRRAFAGLAARVEVVGSVGDVAQVL